MRASKVGAHGGRPALPRTYQEVKRWLTARQMSLRDLAREIDRDPAYVWRVLRGKATSAPLWAEAQAFMRRHRKNAARRRS
ncbi:MAG TPA: hypothetical protein VJ301_14515 [Propionibacteriaceae bacterium]|nr:hypothetical protein [Propionibacteriaceae bacterium]